jgi:hypothetical protein
MAASDAKSGTSRYFALRPDSSVLVSLHLWQCDEVFPRCGLCRKLEKDCSLITVSLADTQVALDGRTSSALSVDLENWQRPSYAQKFYLQTRSVTPQMSLIPELLPPHLQSLPITDLELLYYTMRRDQVLEQDTGDGILMGFSFPFLLHNILSLSAIRLFSEQSTRLELLDRACVHQHLALTLVHPQLVNLSLTNIQAVLKFSSIASVIALAQPLYQNPYQSSTEKVDVIDGIIGSFHMTRGIKAILERQWQLSGISFPQENFVLDHEDPWELSLMSTNRQYRISRDLIRQHCQSKNETLVCLDACQKLFSFITILEREPHLHLDARLVQVWPIEVQKEYIDMLRARRPNALLILGYYTALMQLRSDTAWPFFTWPVVLLRRVDELLGKDWATHLQWVKDRVLIQRHD